MPHTKTQFIDGYSKSAWKSLAVKSLRLGWPNGLRRAQEALGGSTMKSILTTGVFEDTFPPCKELQAVMAEVRALDYQALCRRDTHHARGFTQAFCALKNQALDAREHRKRELWASAKSYGLWLPPRSLNVWFTWLKLRPEDSPQPTRQLDQAPWTGMPEAILDSHTLEGCQRHIRMTILSGHYEAHAQLETQIRVGGWKRIRKQVHAHTRPEHQEPQQSLEL